MMSSRRRYLVPLFVVAAAIVACSDDDVTTSSSSGSASSSGGPSTSTSSGNVGPGASSSSSGFVVEPGGIDPSSLVVMTLTNDRCGRVAGYCGDATAVRVDFVNAKITKITCVELGGNDGGAVPDAGPPGTEDAEETRDLTPQNIQTIKELVAALKYYPEGISFDGGRPAPGSPLKTLDSTTRSNGQAFYSTVDTSCSPRSDTRKILSGWDELWFALRGL